MGQSMSSTGGAKQKGARANRKNQPEAETGQRMSDQGGAKGLSHGKKGSKGKPEGGADHGARSVR